MERNGRWQRLPPVWICPGRKYNQNIIYISGRRQGGLRLVFSCPLTADTLHSVTEERSSAIAAGLNILSEYGGPVDISGDAMKDELCVVLARDGLYYTNVDDFHLLSDVKYKIPEIKCRNSADTIDISFDNNKIPGI